MCYLQDHRNHQYRTFCDPSSVTRIWTDLAPKHLRGLLTIVQDRVDNRPKPARPSRGFFTLGDLLRLIFGKKKRSLHMIPYRGKLRRSPNFYFFTTKSWIESRISEVDDFQNLSTSEILDSIQVVKFLKFQLLRIFPA